MALGVPVHSIQKLTKIDNWFLMQIQDLVKLEKEIQKYSLHNISKELLLKAKVKGYSDAQLAYLLGRIEEEQVYQKRLEFNIKRCYKMVDTCAAEFEAKTPYYYSTFDTENESIVSDKKKVIVLGSGPNRIGQGIEFDYCCVHGLLAIKEVGYEAIMLNAILKRFLLILILRINYISSRFFGNICKNSSTLKNQLA